MNSINLIKEGNHFDFGHLVCDDSLYNEFEKLLISSEYSGSSDGDVLVGKITSRGDVYAVVDVGLKSEGKIAIKDLLTGMSSDDVKVGDEVKVFIEDGDADTKGGYIKISREKALRKECWSFLENAAKNGDTIEGIIKYRVKCGFSVEIMGGVIAFLPGSQLDIKLVKDTTPLMNTVQQFKILKMDRSQGNIVVSRKAVLEALRYQSRADILKTIEESMIVEGTVKNITDYGAFIDLGYIDGLVHIHDLSWRRVNHPSEVLSIGQKVKAKVTKFNKETQRISLGLKQLEDNPWVGVSKKYPVGSRHYGTITNVNDYGVFVELMHGIEGLAYLTELDWHKPFVNIKSIYHRGQEVQVEILSVDEDKNRISLSLKRCTPNPWQKFAEVHPVGSIVDGIVKHIIDFGIFVGFDNNNSDQEFSAIDGLVYINDITWDDNQQNNEFVKNNIKKDSRIKVKVLAIDVDRERISLGIKQVEFDPLENRLSTLKIGDVFDATVLGISHSNEYLELEIEHGVTGCIPIIEFALPHVRNSLEKADTSNDKNRDRYHNRSRSSLNKDDYDLPSDKKTLKVKITEIKPELRFIGLTIIKD